MAAMEQRRTGGRVGLSALLSGAVAGLVGLVTAPALAQAGAAVTGADGLTGWGDLGLAGAAVCLAIWGMREEGKKRLEDSQRYASDVKAEADRHAGQLAELNERRLAEEREHREAVERIYLSKTETYEQLLRYHERDREERQLLLQDLLRRVLDGPREGASALHGGAP